MNDFQQVEILLAEDSAADAEMTMRTLRKRGIANRVVWVKDGAEALDYLFSQGEWAVLHNITRHAPTNTSRVVMFTSGREAGDLFASYKLGVNSFVVKPVDFDRFAETVAEVGMYWMITNQATA